MIILFIVLRANVFLYSYDYLKNIFEFFFVTTHEKYVILLYLHKKYQNLSVLFILTLRFRVMKSCLKNNYSDKTNVAKKGLH